MNFKTIFNALLCTFMLNCQIQAKQNMEDQTAPLFSAQAAFPDECICPLNLQDYIGKYFIVLYFYPMDNTPGCTKQAEVFRNGIAKLERHGFTVLRHSYFYSYLLPVAILFRVTKSLLGVNVKMRSDFIALPRWLNRFLLSMSYLEQYATRFVRIPAGLSVICVCKKI